MGFEQATIKVERETEFEQLKGAISRVFAGQVEKFLKQLQRSGKRVRDFEAAVGPWSRPRTASSSPIPTGKSST